MIFSIPLFKVKSTYNALKDISDGTDESQIFLQPVIYRDQSSLERWSEYLAAYWIPINTVVFISGLVFVGIATWNFQYECSPKALGTYSPAYDRLPVKWETRTFNNTFWPDEPASIFQQVPSSKVDQAWNRVSSTAGIKVSAKEIQKSGRDPRATWPWPEYIAPGSYVAIMDVYHQTHCLDMMRRAAFPEYYGDLRKVYEDGPQPFEDHLLHCQYMLVKAITCHANLEIVTFHKVKGVPGPFPIFSTTRRCKNWEEIQDWKEANEIQVYDEDRFDQTPPGIIEMEAIGRALPYPSTKLERA